MHLFLARDSVHRDREKNPYIYASKKKSNEDTFPCAFYLFLALYKKRFVVSNLPIRIMRSGCKTYNALWNHCENFFFLTQKLPSP